MRTPDDEWWARLGHAFNSHVREEVSVLEAYEQLAEKSKDEGTRYLLELIMTDERRHHDVFEQLAGTISQGTGRGLPEPPAAQQGEDLLAATRRLLAIERGDARALQRLRRELKPVACDTMWQLLVDMMVLDTSKHIRLLEYLVGRLS